MNPDLVNKSVVLLMALGITALFLAMIQPFLLSLLMAGVFAALARPLFLHLQARFNGRRHLASLATLLIMAVVVLIPLAILISVLVAQALDVTQSVTLWVRQMLDRPGALTDFLSGLPFYEKLLPHWGQILQQAGQTTAALSKYAVDVLSSVTLGALNLVFMSFVFLYSLYFLQMDGHRLIERMLYYLPLKTSDERLLLEKFTSVTRATIKGTVLIGLLQGTLAGIAFAVAGVPNAVFWGSVMAILSVIPNVGPPVVWIPTVVILILQGDVVTGAALGLFCGLVVGTLDNVLRPILVGKDTKMHELMIFFGTLGGILMFGFPGLFIGPVIASLFISIWELYGVEFGEVLPDVDSVLLGLQEHPGEAGREGEGSSPDWDQDDGG
jgi:predicted PurR-regulated permease PerM